MFVDEAIITVRSGAGGNGCLSFRREKFVPKGGPDGGSGGRGGSVILVADRNLATLIDVSRRPVYKAERGQQGGGSKRTGRCGKGCSVKVPVGTLVRAVEPEKNAEEGRILGDLLEDGQRLTVAKGGGGGRGNSAFTSPTHQAPRIAEEGKPGEEFKLYLELKLLADVGLVGLPNAGKSTLVSRVSAARPKIADYPFTTLEPHLGLVDIGSYERLVFADLPGLIEGAHQGHGLGLEFLRHLGRTRALLHLVSVESGSLDSIEEDYRRVDTELREHSDALAGRPRIVVVSKTDLLPEAELSALIEGLSRRLEAPVYPLSAVTGFGLEPLLSEASRLVASVRAEE
jgi:GTP-binding protein